MFISRKRLRDIENRLFSLEREAAVLTYKWGKVDLENLARITEKIVAQTKALQAEANRVSFDRAVGLAAERYEMEKEREDKT